MALFKSFSGIITNIDHLWRGSTDRIGCTKLVSVENRDEGIVNFVVTPDTYFVDGVMIKEGDFVTGFYDALAPTPLIFPPQLRAIVMTKVSEYQNVKVDYFDTQLISSDGTLKLNLSPLTPVLLENGQPFITIPRNRNLVVVYGPTTRSIPAQTTPYKIIVLC
ncbi:hypothetical protein GOQ27_07180 [Clostridium sp. D2Q-11]|uniref:Uncharacterized protein n=1 Tax=Anaeromonas frigoriresistens TaxID=2683708 RepID=A0A942UVG0_9FIRM|nr:hypothetical protein [Anaeromonas frigoriresistens]MBS4538240.1 hypothetical protein [Anaeromonas frigoriresistens]